MYINAQQKYIYTKFLSDKTKDGSRSWERKKRELAQLTLYICEF